MNCTKCGQPCAPGTSFCGQCGTKLSQLTVVAAAPEAESACPHCRKSVSVHATKCPYCGSDVAVHMYAVRDPQSFAMGMMGGVIGVIVGIFIHHKMLSDFMDLVSNSRGCAGVCLLPCHATGAFLLTFMLGLYFAGGAFAGMLLQWSLKK